MAQPLSRPGITKLIDTTLKDNSQQYITAARLRSVVNPIVDSTYGMKTIWAGCMEWQATITSSPDSTNNIDYVTVTEAYADTNWFPDTSDYDASASRYSIVDAGLNILADNGTGTGTISDCVTTTTSFSPSNIGAKGGGARFNLTISNGQCVGIEVTNPGTGYSLTYTKAPLAYKGDFIFPNVNFTSGGRVPTLKFSTFSAVWPSKTEIAYTDSNGQVDYAWNVFLPDLITKIPVPTTAYVDSNIIQINVKDRTGIYTPTLTIAIPAIPGSFVSYPGSASAPGAPSGSSTYNHYHNPMIAAATYTIDRPVTVSGARSQQTSNWIAAGEGVAEYITGFFFKQWNRRSNTSNVIKCRTDIEIRVPIINPTPVII